MKRRLTIEIDERAAALADKMITDGDCHSLDEAFERSVVIASGHDARSRELEATWSPEMLAELTESVREAIDNPQPAPPGFRAELAKLRNTPLGSAAG